MGQDNRELYVVDAPPTTLREDITPKQINKSPETTPTLIVRQNGINGKKHPFVSVFEPYATGEKSIEKITKVGDFGDMVSLKVTSTHSTQVICNSIDGNTVYKPAKNLKFKGTLGVASEKNGKFDYLYLGKGKLLQNGKYKIEAVNEAVSAALRIEDGKYYYSSDKPVIIQINKKGAKEYPAGYNLEIK